MNSARVSGFVIGVPTVRPLTFAIRPNDYECLVSAVAVVTEEMVCDSNVPGEFGCCMVVRKVDSRFVVHEDLDWSANELSRDALDHVDYPQK